MADEVLVLGPGEDVLIVVIGPEHQGRTRAIGHKVGLKEGIPGVLRKKKRTLVDTVWEQKKRQFDAECLEKQTLLDAEYKEKQRLFDAECEEKKKSYLMPILMRREGCSLQIWRRRISYLMLGLKC